MGAGSTLRRRRDSLEGSDHNSLFLSPAPSIVRRRGMFPPGKTKSVTFLLRRRDLFLHTEQSLDLETHTASRRVLYHCLELTVPFPASTSPPQPCANAAGGWDTGKPEPFPVSDGRWWLGSVGRFPSAKEPRPEEQVRWSGSGPFSSGITVLRRDPSAFRTGQSSRTPAPARSGLCD